MLSHPRRGAGPLAGLGRFPGTSTQRHLNGIPEIRSYFRMNTDPIYFFGPTGFNLLGIDRWVRNFHYVVYYDSWDGAHPRVFTPRSKPYVEFDSSEQIVNYLLRDPEVQAFLGSRGGRPRVAMSSSTRRPRGSARSWVTT